VLISPELARAFNDQIGHEFGASMQYVSIAAHFRQRQLTLLSKLFMAQADEERLHAMKFVQYLLDTRQISGSRRWRRPFRRLRPRRKRFRRRSTGRTGHHPDHQLMEMAVKQNDYLAQNFRCGSS
jgi:ferritin